MWQLSCVLLLQVHIENLLSCHIMRALALAVLCQMSF